MSESDDVPRVNLFLIIDQSYDDIYDHDTRARVIARKISCAHDGNFQYVGMNHFIKNMLDTMSIQGDHTTPADTIISYKNRYRRDKTLFLNGESLMIHAMKKCIKKERGESGDLIIISDGNSDEVKLISKYKGISIKVDEKSDIIEHPYGVDYTVQSYEELRDIFKRHSVEYDYSQTKYKSIFFSVILACFLLYVMAAKPRSA